MIIKAVETITSTDLCGPRFLRYDLTDNHVLIFLTLFNRKCGNSDLRALLDDVKCENNLAYKNLCLNVRSATASKKKNKQARVPRSIRAMIMTVLSLKINAFDSC